MINNTLSKKYIGNIRKYFHTLCCITILLFSCQEQLVAKELVYNENKMLIQIEPNLAKEYFTDANEGIASAQTKLGYMYLRGVYYVKDEKIAAKWFEKAAISGYAEGQTQLALLYGSGVGVKEDLDKAIFWLGKAAKQNDQQALDLLHWMSQAAH